MHVWHYRVALTLKRIRFVLILSIVNVKMFWPKYIILFTELLIGKLLFLTCGCPMDIFISPTLISNISTYCNEIYLKQVSFTFFLKINFYAKDTIVLIWKDDSQNNKIQYFKLCIILFLKIPMIITWLSWKSQNYLDIDIPIFCFYIKQILVLFFYLTKTAIWRFLCLL